jgi:HPt (histidine-containing phosphotransfer) domain-containing protein
MEFLHIDPAVLLSAAAGDGETCRSLSRTYLDITPDMMAKLAAALLAGDKTGAALHAHALKGCTMLVGAAQLSAVLARTERLARRDDTPGDDFPALLPDIERLYALVADEVRASIAQFGQA